MRCSSRIIPHMSHIGWSDSNNLDIAFRNMFLSCLHPSCDPIVPIKYRERRGQDAHLKLF